MKTIISLLLALSLTAAIADECRSCGNGKSKFEDMPARYLSPSQV